MIPAQIPYAMMKFVYPLTGQFLHLPSWVTPFKVLAFSLLLLISLIFGAIVYFFIKEVFVKIILDLAKKLEPKPITETRSKLTTDLEAIQNHIEKTKNDSFKLQCENSLLRDKVNDLEKVRKALIEELGGSSNSTSVEFELWQQLITVLDILVHDRVRLLRLLDTAVSCRDQTNISVDVDKLLQEADQLRQRYQKSQEELVLATKTVEQLNKENRSLKARDYDYEQEVERLRSKAFEKSEEVHGLRQTIKNLEDNVKKLRSETIAASKKLAKLEKERNELISQSGECERVANLYVELIREKEKYEHEVTEKSALISELQLLLEQAENRIEIALEESKNDLNHCQTSDFSVMETDYQDDCLSSGECWQELRQLRRRVSRSVERQVLLELRAACIEDVLELT